MKTESEVYTRKIDISASKASTIDEILPSGPLNKKLKTTLRSDHEPKIAHTFIKNNFGKEAKITLMSYNVHALRNNWSGFEGQEDWEANDDDDKTRYQAIADYITAIVDARQADLICLQESNKPLSELLSETLNKITYNAWSFLPSDANQQTVVLYNNNVFTPCEKQISSPRIIPSYKGDKIVPENFIGGQLWVNEISDRISVFSGHVTHDVNPNEFERVIAEMGEQFDTSTVFIGCDTNRHVANLSAVLEDNANNVKPPIHRLNAGSHDSTDACFKVEKTVIEQLPTFTPDPKNPSKNIARPPRFDLARSENPYRRVLSSMYHTVPVGQQEMNALVFAKELTKKPWYLFLAAQAQVNIEVSVATRTNEKLLRIYTTQPIKDLEELGLSRQGQAVDEHYYDLEFAYPGVIESDNFTKSVEQDTDKTFFIRVDGKVKCCSLDGSHRFEKLIINDIAIFVGSMAVPALIGAAIGGVIGGLAFPIIGIGPGAGFGLLCGEALGTALAGYQSFFRNRLIGREFTSKQRTAAGLMTAFGLTGLGAVAGSILFPGIGTLIGLSVGLALTALTLLTTLEDYQISIQRLLAGFIVSIGLTGLFAIIGSFVFPGAGTVIGACVGLGLGSLISIIVGWAALRNDEQIKDSLDSKKNYIVLEMNDELSSAKMANLFNSKPFHSQEKTRSQDSLNYAKKDSRLLLVKKPSDCEESDTEEVYFGEGSQRTPR
ncbi:MAG: hypothetical protein H0U70_02115 [Tatlockia sp.]|nr:hypothetical protein [Tatlockia sp.]